MQENVVYQPQAVVTFDKQRQLGSLPVLPVLQARLTQRAQPARSFDVGDDYDRVYCTYEDLDDDGE